MTLRERALGLLARREHSRAELARKLAAHATAEEIAAVLDVLERQGLLSEARYAEAQARTASGRYGSVRLEQTLQRQGVNGALLESMLKEARALDFAACQALWQRKYGRHAADSKEKARQYRFLLSRGFPSDVVSRVLEGKAAD